MDKKVDIEKSKKVMIIFYSVYGHVEKLAKEIAVGVNSVKGVKAEIWRVPETSKILHSEDYPVLTHDKLEDFAKSDAFLFGMTSQFGTMPHQFKEFWDSTGGLWTKGSLVGKPAGLFFSTNAQGGGQESTALTSITQLTHHGMVYVPTGYAMGPELANIDKVKGGSAWGSGTISGADESGELTELELKFAKYQGETFAKFLLRIKD